MRYSKKSLGQNFLKDLNIIKKIVSLSKITNNDIVEIGPGRGALTDQILKKKPKSLILIEKDFFFANKLKTKYSKNKSIKVLNYDILKFELGKVIKKETIIFGNLPYNISSQILVKILKLDRKKSQYGDLIFMFQKELGEKIIGRYPSKNYGRLAILSNYKLDIYKKFFVSSNCFFPKPKVTSIVIHFRPKKKYLTKIKNINNLEKITNNFFSNKRKMINKSIKKLLNKKKLSHLTDLNLKLRPSDISPEMYYKITELYERD